MADTGSEPKSLTELQRSIRELFRIFVPGAYALLLLQLLTPGTPALTRFEQSTLAQGIAIFFAGLFGYALRAHERWWPYFLWFESERVRLDNAIRRVLP